MKKEKKIDKSQIIEAVNYEFMTSLEVAKLTGMRHSDLLRDIRKMERAWDEVMIEDPQLPENECERKFAFASVSVCQPNGSAY